MKANVIVLPIIAIFLISGCVQEQRNNETIKIGVLQPLTNVYGGVYGEQSLLGAQLAVDDINSRGGINGKRVEIVAEDSRYDVPTSISAFNKLIYSDNVKIIIVSGSGVILSLEPLAKNNSVVLLNTVASSPKLSNKTQIFNFVPLADQESKEFAPILSKTFSIKKLALLTTTDDAGTGVEKAFIETFGALGNITANEKYGNKDNDVRTQLLRVKDTNPDGILIAGTQMGIIVKQARELGIEKPFFSISYFENPDFLEQGQDSLDGVVFSSIEIDKTNPQVSSFISKYMNRSANMPAYFAFTSYDAIMFAAEAMKNCDEDEKCMREYLENKSLSGLSGTIDFDTTHKRLYRTSLRTVEDMKFKDYEEMVVSN